MVQSISNLCNVSSADGQLTGTEQKGLYCVQCNEDTDTGACAKSALTRTACGNGERYCYSRATYFIANTTHAAGFGKNLANSM